MEKKQNKERNNKNSRSPKSTTQKLKYRVTSETGDIGLLRAEKRGKKRRHIGKRIFEGMFSNFKSA